MDSVSTKTNAYRVLFAEFGDEAVEQIVQYQLTYGGLRAQIHCCCFQLFSGLSRFLKFKWAFENVLKLPLSEERSQQLGQEFSKLVEQQVPFQWHFKVRHSASQGDRVSFY